MTACRSLIIRPQEASRPATLAAIAATIAVTGLALASIARGDLVSQPNYVAARNALADGLPQVAVAKLDEMLTAPAVGNLDAEARILVERLRLEALVRGGDYSTALASSEQINDTAADTLFWLALAEAGSGRLADAARRLNLLESASDFKYLAEARLNRAHLLHQLGDDAAALEVLDSIGGDESASAGTGLALTAQLAAARLELMTGQLQVAERRLAVIDAPTADYLRAWIAVEHGDAETAIAGFVALMAAPPATLNRAIHDGARFGLARAHLLTGNEAAARQELITLLEETADSPLAAPAMRLLTTPPLRGDADIASKIDHWRSDADLSSNRRGLAVYYHALEQLRQGAYASGRKGLERFLADYPHHELGLEARLSLAERLLADGEVDGARALIVEIEILSAHPAVLDQVDYLNGLADFDEGDLAGAITGFRKAVRLESNRRDRASTFNVALARLHADTEVSVETILEEHGTTLGLSESRAELLLERGLYLARQGNAAAFEVLGEFVRRFNDHRRAADAEIALSELHLNQLPPKPVSAREHIESAKGRELTIDQREQLDHVSIWVEESAGEDRQVIVLAHRFLDEWLDSRLRPSVLMKLGETYYQRGEFSKASEIFTRLTNEAPGSAYAPAAQFFAAKAASLSLDPDEQQRGLRLWSVVVDSAGPFAAAARHEKGLSHLRLDKLDEAIASFQEVLDLQPPPSPDLRFATLCDIGQAWFTKTSAEATEDADFASAIEAFDKVIEDNGASLAWKAQAMVRKAKCLEVMGDTTAALALYHDTLDTQDQPPITTGTTEAQEWYYRAGFAAIRLLEREKQWPAAVTIANRLGRRGGPRSIEAEELADRLRLEHFIWDK